VAPTAAATVGLGRQDRAPDIATPDLRRHRAQAPAGHQFDPSWAA
jgi:hypothetical protein